MKRILFILMIAVVATTAAAQDRSKWTNEMLEAKHNMIAEQVGLTPSQKERFMPLYEAMEKEIYQTNRDARALAGNVGKKANPTDAEYLQAAEAMSNAKVREGEIEKKYFEKFSAILSNRQLFLLKQTEANFTREMLRGRKKSKN